MSELIASDFLWLTTFKFSDTGKKEIWNDSIESIVDEITWMIQNKIEEKEMKKEMKKKREKIQPKMSSSTNESNWGNYKRDFQMVIIILCYNSTTQGIQTQAIITLFDSQFTSNLDPSTQQASINFNIQIAKPKLKPRLDVMWWCDVMWCDAVYRLTHHMIAWSHWHFCKIFN